MWSGGVWRALKSGDSPNGPTVTVEGPLVGLKYAAVVAVDGELRFCGTTARSRHSRCYDTDAIATCQQGQDHRPPAWACTCGFYAHATDQQLEHSWGELRRPYWARLVVELSGRVVEHDRGWRASRQVVLEASWEDRCETCSEHRADGFGPSDRLPGAIVPRCRACAGPSWLPVGEVAGRLGTDVRLVRSALPQPAAVSGPPLRRRRLGRQLASRFAVLVTIVAAASALVALGGGPRPTTGPPDLVQELRPHVDLWDPESTARQLAEHVDRPDLRTVVLADDGAPTGAAAAAVVSGPAAPQERRSGLSPTLGAVAAPEEARDDRARRPIVTAIAVFGPAAAGSDTGPCRVVLLRPGLPSSSWAVVPTAASTLETCVGDAAGARTVHTVDVATQTS